MLVGPMALAAAVMAFGVGPGLPSAGTAGPAQDPEVVRHVTVFGIEAIPGRKIRDLALTQVASQLEKLKPDHGFRLLGAKSERVERGEEVVCDVEAGRELRVALLEDAGPDGKVKLRVKLMPKEGEEPLFEAEVSTPPNQLLFLDKELDGASGKVTLLVGLGAR